MKSRFPLTLGSVQYRRRGSYLGELAIAVAVFLWLAWFLGSSIDMHSTSLEAKVLIDQKPHHIGTSSTKRVLEVPIEVGSSVRMGDPLVLLDGKRWTIRRDEAIAVAQALQREIASVESLLEIEKAALSQNQQAKEAALSAAIGRVSAARAASKNARAQAARTEKLFELGLTSEQSFESHRADGEQKQAEETALEATLVRLEWDFSAGESERRARLSSVEGEIASLQAEFEHARAERQTSEAELERSILRAPVDGTIGALAEIGPGATVQPGEFIVTLIPEGGFRVVAFFKPSSALGRIVVGQPTILRLDALPWTRFGTVRGRVERLGNEARDEQIRVEATIDSVPSGITLQHGLTGTLEVQIETVSPAVATLRFLAAGPTE